MALTKKQSLFIDEYIKDLNATQAAIRAGYKEKAAGQMGDENLKKPQIKAVIDARIKERSDQIKVDGQYVVKRLLEIDAMDVLDILKDDMSIKPISEWPKVWRTYISAVDVSELLGASDPDGGQKSVVAILKKIKWPDKLKNIELLGRHFGIFNDKLDLNVKDGLAERLARAKKRV